MKGGGRVSEPISLFLGWSGDASREVAEALRDWLPEVLPHVSPWLSTQDVQKGEQWGRELKEALESSAFGVFCITPGVADQPWINFEVGVLSSVLDAKGICPVLIGVPSEDLSPPLAQYQAVRLEKFDVLRLLESLNSRCDSPISLDELASAHDVHWDALNRKLSRVSARVEADSRSAQELQRLYSEIASVLAQALAWPADGDYRFLNPWVEERRSGFEDGARRLRLVAAHDEVLEPDLRVALESLADDFDALADSRAYMGNGPDLEARDAKARSAAVELKRMVLGSHPFGQGTVDTAFRDTLRVARELRVMCPRLTDKAFRDVEQVQRDLGALGRTILRWTAVGLPSKGAQGESLRRIGRDLFGVEQVLVLADGGAAIHGIVEVAQGCSERLEQWLSENSSVDEG